MTDENTDASELVDRLKDVYSDDDADDSDRASALESTIEQLAEKRENGLSKSILGNRLTEIKQITGANVGDLKDDIEESRENVGEAYDTDTPLEGEEGWDRVRLAYDDARVDRGAARYDLVRLLENGYHFMAATDDVNRDDKRATLWVYDPNTGMYDENGSAHVSRLIEGKLPEHADRREHSEVLSKLKKRNQVPRESFNAGSNHYLCVKNGVLDVERGELLDGGHSPKHHFIKGIPVRRNINAECPNIDRFFDSIVETDAEKEALYQLVGWCLSSGYSPQSILMLIGDGANGKGTFLRLLRHFLGTDNYVGFDLHTLSKPGSRGNYSGAKLIGKMANLGGDIPGKKLSDLNRIKAFSGGDAVEVREPFKNPITFENEAKLIFAVNEPPIIPETGHQINRRFRHIKFPNEFTDDPDDGNPDKIPEEDLGIHTEEELSGLLNRSLDAFETLQETGEWAHVDDPETHMDRYRELSDPISQFADECLANVSESCVHKGAAYIAYNHWCMENDETVKDKSVFFRALNTSDVFDVSTSRRTDHTGDLANILDTAAFTMQGREYCPDEQLVESDAASKAIHNSTPDEIAERIGEDPDDVEHVERTHADLHEQIFRAIDEVGESTEENVKMAVAFAGGFDSARVENALQTLRTRGELTNFGGELLRTE